MYITRFPRIRLFFSLLIPIVIVFTLLRLGFYQAFLANTQMPSAEFWHSFGIGLRFDFRIALFLLMPIGIISLLPKAIGLQSKIGRFLALSLTTLGVVSCFVFYIFDFGHYAYLGARLNANVLEFLQDGSDTWQMLWESYPVIWMLLLTIAGAAITWLAVSFLVAQFQENLTAKRWLRFTITVPVILAIYFFGIVGKTTSVVPLRWSDAYYTDNVHAVNFALNPIIFFISTLQNASRPYDENILRANYDLIANYLGVDHPDSKNFTFSRKASGSEAHGRRPNVVFIHLESLGANRSGLYGNTLGATPFMDKIAREGYFFPNFMVPASGTARTVFGLITGIPDVTWGGSTATRNPLISQQYTLVNAFTGYKKFYFIGGDAGWANVQGLLQHSISDLQLFQEKDYNAKAVDVWGVSDHSVFSAANAELNKLASDQPFIAFIQLAGNHRPFTIPDEDIGFEKKYLSDEELFKYGFNNLAHYNAVRLQDYNLQLFLSQMAANSHYANNTIYLMYGDHNTRSVLPTVMHSYSEPLGLNNHHVPFIIYAPGIIQQPKEFQRVASLVDLLPTALGMVGLPYENRTLGRDILHWDKDSYAMTFGGDRSSSPSIGLLSQTDYISMLYNGKNARFYTLDNPKDNVIAQQADVVKQRTALLQGLYQSATYLLTHNAAVNSEHKE